MECGHIICTKCSTRLSEANDFKLIKPDKPVDDPKYIVDTVLLLLFILVALFSNSFWQNRFVAQSAAKSR